MSASSADTAVATRGGALAQADAASRRASTGYPPPLVRPAPDGLAERFADRVGATHPVRVFLTAAVTGYLLLASISIAIGLLFVNVILPIGGLAEWDTDLNRRMAEARTAFTEDLSWVGSTLSGGHVIPFVIGLLLVVFAIRRQWLLAVYPLFLILVESGTYRATTLFVERERPPVERLEGLPVDASYPSGHTAASLALYGGLLLLGASWVRRTWFTVLAAALTIAIVAFVGWSRMFRGMHHLTDTIAGVCIGLAAIAVVVFAARAATAAARNRRALEDRT